VPSGSCLSCHAQNVNAALCERYEHTFEYAGAVRQNGPSHPPRAAIIAERLTLVAAVSRNLAMNSTVFGALYGATGPWRTR